MSIKSTAIFDFLLKKFLETYHVYYAILETYQVYYATFLIYHF